jgi:hypothetical protein
VSEAAGVPSEDALVGEQVQHPVQGISINAASSRQHVHARRFRAECVGDSQLTDHLQTTSGHRPGGQGPNKLMGLLLDHARSSHRSGRLAPHPVITVAVKLTMSTAYRR